MIYSNLRIDFAPTYMVPFLTFSSRCHPVQKNILGSEPSSVPPSPRTSNGKLSCNILQCVRSQMLILGYLKTSQHTNFSQLWDFFIADTSIQVCHLSLKDQEQCTTFMLLQNSPSLPMKGQCHLFSRFLIKSCVIFFEILTIVKAITVR